MKKIVKMYLNSNKEENCNIILNAFGIDLLELDEEHPAQSLKYALYEVEFEVEMDLESGSARIISVDGSKLCACNIKRTV